MSPEQARVAIVVSGAVGLAAIAVLEIVRVFGRMQISAFERGLQTGLDLVPDVSPATGEKPAATSAPGA